MKVQNLDAKTDREDSANGEISGMVATGRVCEPRSVRQRRSSRTHLKYCHRGRSEMHVE